MTGQKPIRTVADLMAYLSACPADAEVSLVPEEGTGFGIGGVLQFHPDLPAPPQVWILVDEFTEVGESGYGPENFIDDDEDGAWEAYGISQAPPVKEVEKPDVVKVRGKLRSA